MGDFPYQIEVVLFWLLCTLMFNLVMCGFNVHCNQKDMDMLLKFKQGVTDPTSVLSSWFTEKDCCQWKGVGCDNITGRVTELSLPCHAISIAYSDQVDKSHCLTGEFELSLLDLEFLRLLNLSNNDFKLIQYNPMSSQKCDVLSGGTPPIRCNNFFNLHLLDLSYNHDLLIDNLHWVSNLSSLQYLDLSGIRLDSGIDWLRSVTMLPSLIELHLRLCQLENIYPSLQYANFTALEVLDISGNGFGNSELPGWIFNLSCDISHVILSQNQIYGQLPETLPNLRSIKLLNLSGNSISGPIPDWLGQLEYLQELDLSHNSLSGPIPASLGNLSSLVALHLESNHFSGSLPESLGQLFNLEVLGVGDNPLTGIVSERNFVHLSSLKHLFLSSRTLNYNFDPRWTPPFELDGIQLGYMDLPSWLFTQSSLKKLTITDSIASFEPHDKFWNFAELEYLCLDNNQLHADMSNVLLNATVIVLSSNYLKGGLPKISQNVVVLDLSNNYFSGSISSLLCDKMEGESKLEYLDISSNLLYGELTNCWMQLKSLVYIDLGNNILTGKIPHSVGFLSNLVALTLSGNKFFGEVPLSLKNCQNLSVLDLGGNKFSGPMPNWIGRGRMQVLNFRSNRFSGHIPQQICQLNSVRLLDFANNRLSGPIPNCLHNMTAMISHNISLNWFRIKEADISSIAFPIRMVFKGRELEYTTYLFPVLDLSSNNLSGTIPLGIFTLTGLISLNLSHNQLVGMIPKEIDNLKVLEVLDLSWNLLSGQIPQSIVSLTFLSFLNLSFNNFMGQIPSGKQFSTFDNDSYVGNPELCGPPLTKSCLDDEKPHNTNQKGEDNDSQESKVHSWFFYHGFGIGFATGFVGVLGIIFFNRRCRCAYFKFLGRMYNMLVQKQAPPTRIPLTATTVVDH